MANQLKIKRGLKASAPVLSDGEPGWATDTLELLVGQSGVNRRVGDGIFLPLGGGTLSGALTLSGDPTNPLHAATKQYVDAARAGLDVKASVRVATTATITLSGLQTIDGVSLNAADRVLVKDQTTASENGIYVAGTGAWSRATDADSDAKVTSGLFTFVEEGTSNSDAGYVLVTHNPITLDTTGLAFTRFSAAADIVAGAGLTKTGATLDVGAGDGIQVDADAITVKLDGATLAKSASGLKIASGGITPTELATSVAGSGLTGGAGSALSVV